MHESIYIHHSKTTLISIINSLAHHNWYSSMQHTATTMVTYSLFVCISNARISGQYVLMAIRRNKQFWYFQLSCSRHDDIETLHVNSMPFTRAWKGRGLFKLGCDDNTGISIRWYFRAEISVLMIWINEFEMGSPSIRYCVNVLLV